MTDEQAILHELLRRFKRMDEAGDAVDRFGIWSCAHAMADDAKRVIAIMKKKERKKR